MNTNNKEKIEFYLGFAVIISLLTVLVVMMIENREPLIKIYFQLIMLCMVAPLLGYLLSEEFR